MRGAPRFPKILLVKSIWENPGRFASLEIEVLLVKETSRRLKTR